MATSKTTEPSAEGITVESIASTGASLTRLLVALIPVPVTLAKSIGSSLAELIAGVTKALGGTASPQAGNDVAKATGDLFSAGAGLYLSLLKATLSTLDATKRAVDASVADFNKPGK